MAREKYILFANREILIKYAAGLIGDNFASELAEYYDNTYPRGHALVPLCHDLYNVKYGSIGSDNDGSLAWQFPSKRKAEWVGAYLRGMGAMCIKVA